MCIRDRKRTIEKYDNRGPISIEEHEEQKNNFLIIQKENEDLKQVLNLFVIILFDLNAFNAISYQQLSF